MRTGLKVHEQRARLQRRLALARTQVAQRTDPEDAARHAEAVAARLKQRLDGAEALNSSGPVAAGAVRSAARIATLPVRRK